MECTGKTCRGKTGNRPIERVNREKTESDGKPDFSVVYATRIEFVRATIWFFRHIAVVEFVDGPALFAGQEPQYLCGSAR